MISDERTASRILEHLGLLMRAPPRGRPWRPGQLQPAVDGETIRFEGIVSDAAQPRRITQRKARYIRFKGC
jgi:hypothetical protein